MNAIASLCYYLGAGSFLLMTGYGAFKLFIWMIISISVAGIFPSP